jgi:hypothetical protein
VSDAQEVLMYAGSEVKLGRRFRVALNDEEFDGTLVGFLVGTSFGADTFCFKTGTFVGKKDKVEHSTYRRVRREFIVDMQRVLFCRVCRGDIDPTITMDVYAKAHDGGSCNRPLQQRIGGAA